MNSEKPEFQISRQGDKFIVLDKRETKFFKKQKLDKVSLPDGKSYLQASEGLLEGTEECMFEEKEDHFLLTVTTTMKFAPNYFMRLATSVRQLRDGLKPNKEAYDYYEKQWQDIEPFVKQATMINKRIEKIMERAGKKNNPELQDEESKV